MTQYFLVSRDMDFCSFDFLGGHSHINQLGSGGFQMIIRLDNRGGFEFRPWLRI